MADAACVSYEGEDTCVSYAPYSHLSWLMLHVLASPRRETDKDIVFYDDNTRGCLRRTDATCCPNADAGRHGDGGGDDGDADGAGRLCKSTLGRAFI